MFIVLLGGTDFRRTYTQAYHMPVLSYERSEGNYVKICLIIVLHCPARFCSASGLLDYVIFSNLYSTLVVMQNIKNTGATLLILDIMCHATQQTVMACCFPAVHCSVSSGLKLPCLSEKVNSNNTVLCFSVTVSTLHILKRYIYSNYKFRSSVSYVKRN